MEAAGTRMDAAATVEDAAVAVIMAVEITTPIHKEISMLASLHKDISMLASPAVAPTPIPTSITTMTGFAGHVGLMWTTPVATAHTRDGQTTRSAPHNTTCANS